MPQYIEDITLEHLSSDGSGSEADVEDFKAACVNYQLATGCTDEDAIDAIYGDGAFGERVRRWSLYPDDPGLVHEEDDEDEVEDDLTVCPVCAGPVYPLGSLGARQHFRCRHCGLDLSHPA